MTPFPQFPKVRPPLAEPYSSILRDYYKVNREGGTTATSLAQRMERWLHRKVAGDVTGSGRAGNIRTLEIGAGTLPQLRFEPVVGPYDIIEPREYLYRGSPRLGRVRAIYADISDLPDDASYERITSTATFEHIENLPDVVAAAARHLAPGGSLRVAIPSEGTPLWALGWKLTTGLEFRLKHGLDYGVLMRHEHINTAREIEDVLHFTFREVQCRVFGLSRWLSLYQFFVCRAPNTMRCKSTPVA